MSHHEQERLLGKFTISCTKERTQKEMESIMERGTRNL
jgi:hypothetical protein